jgi:hypothetical protein
VATTADEAMAPAGEKNLFREATDMLKEAFAHGSVPADEMGKMAKSTDISIRTFRRAAIAMGAKSRKQIGTGKWRDLSPAGERGG